MAIPRIRAPPLLHPRLSPAPSLRLVAQSAFSPSQKPNSAPPYVLHVVRIPQGYLLAGSDDSLRAFSPTLQLLATLKSSQRGITSLVRGFGEASTAVFTTARDGTVVGWDTRDLTKEAFKLKGKSGAPYLTCAQSSDLACLAVGAELHHHEATIDLWDLRTLSLSQTYSEAHSDDLTTLSFHPTLPHVLLSASVDGLINTYDVRVVDEDDALLTTAKAGASLGDAGWMPLPSASENGEFKGIWGVTTIETLQLWDAEESKLIVDMGDIRDVCLEPWRSDYLIQSYYDPFSQSMCLLAGTQRGDIAIINLKDPENWVLEQLLPGTGGRSLGGSGHSDIVRCASLDTKASTLVTGGEDGQICLWSV